MKSRKKLLNAFPDKSFDDIFELIEELIWIDEAKSLVNQSKKGKAQK